MFIMELRQSLPTILDRNLATETNDLMARVSQRPEEDEPEPETRIIEATKQFNHFFSYKDSLQLCLWPEVINSDIDVERTKTYAS